VLKVLIVDDQPAVCIALQLLFDIHDLPALVVNTPAAALEALDREPVGVVVQDMNFSADTTSGEEGVALFREIRRRHPEMPVLLVTAWTSLETAVQLVKEGASDYLAKPWDDVKLVEGVRSLMRQRSLDLEHTKLRGQRVGAREALARLYDLRGLVYESEAMHATVSMAVRVAAADVPVLVTGPNGSGKEKLAEIVQANSRRRDAAFVRVNSGALPDQLLEAELFGAEAGAFTGAQRLRIGRFEAAHGGTLFLDEIGNLSLPGQMKLLRALQTGEFERVGSSVTRRADVRVVSATNADLPAAIAAGTFREDLYFRLNVIELKVPPLRARRDDVLPLAEHFLAATPAPMRLSAGAREALRAHDWPGNVRELQNRLQRASLMAAGGVIEAGDLGLEGGVAPPPPAAAAGDPDPERGAVEAALRRHGGVVAKAADELGLSRQALYRRMERLGIVIERRFKA
jgi:DNA-binding NtrC family response regulator